MGWISKHAQFRCIKAVNEYYKVRVLLKPPSDCVNHSYYLLVSCASRLMALCVVSRREDTQCAATFTVTSAGYTHRSKTTKKHSLHVLLTYVCSSFHLVCNTVPFTDDSIARDRARRLIHLWMRRYSFTGAQQCTSHSSLHDSYMRRTEMHGMACLSSPGILISN